MELAPAIVPPESKDLMVYKDHNTNELRYLDLRTGKPYDCFVELKPGLFSNGLADLLCADIREGKTMKKACLEQGISISLFYSWLAVFPEFKKRYIEARKQRADYHFYKVMDMADDAEVAEKEAIPGLKLAMDAHKWAAEKSDPERFAKPKDEGNNGVGSITINLQTGVLDRAAPLDIRVDAFGNFQGFGTEEIVEDGEVSRDIILTKDRWEIHDGDFNDSTEESESTNVEP